MASYGMNFRGRTWRRCDMHVTVHLPLTDEQVGGKIMNGNNKNQGGVVHIWLTCALSWCSWTAHIGSSPSLRHVSLLSIQRMAVLRQPAW